MYSTDQQSLVQIYAGCSELFEICGEYFIQKTATWF